MSVTLWKMDARGKRTALEPAYERLNAMDPPGFLSLSLFEEEGDATHARLEALFEDQPDTDAFLETAGLTQDAADIEFAPLPEEDWVALSLEGLQPVSAGRFTVHGRHDLDKVPHGATPILIEAGQAFGTGHHGTTRGCLMAFDDLLKAGETFGNILDLGCGAGTLAIAAAKTLRGAAIMASDNDPLAVEVTLENAGSNRVAGRITALTAEGFEDAALREAAPFDLIFANILAAPLIALSGDIAGALAPGGRTILSGLLVEQEDRVRKAFEAAGLTQESRAAIDDWATLVMRRPA